MKPTAAAEPVDRADLQRRIRSVTKTGPHGPDHIATFVDAVLDDPVPGVLVECGCYKGVSAAKFSHLAAALGRELWLFDSFQGLPANDERHTVTRAGASIRGAFQAGAWNGSLQEVQDTIGRYGAPEVVRYAPGWFEATLPAWASLGTPVAGAYLDVDLASSARTCLENLWPVVTPGGVVVSQDGDFPLTVDAMAQWASQADPAPRVAGLGASKMVTFWKPRHG